MLVPLAYTVVCVVLVVGFWRGWVSPRAALLAVLGITAFSIVDTLLKVPPGGIHFWLDLALLMIVTGLTALTIWRPLRHE